MATAQGPSAKRGVQADREFIGTPFELDELDLALIDELRQDGRAGNRALAARLGVNEVTIAARLRRMEEAEVMRVVAITDIRLFGHREFAFAMIKVVGRSVNPVAADLARLPETIGVTVCTGRYDIVVGLLGRDRRHLAELFGTVLPKIKGTGRVFGNIALDVVKYDSKWALFGVDSGSMPETQPNDTVDQMDLAIIAELQQNARRSNRQIAADLGVSEGTVRIRIKQMLADRVFASRRCRTSLRLASARMLTFSSNVFQARSTTWRRHLPAEMTLHSSLESSATSTSWPYFTRPTGQH